MSANKMINRKHLWIANGGRGGKPEFRKDPFGRVYTTMSVRCGKCGARQFLSREEWTELNVVSLGK